MNLCLDTTGMRANCLFDDGSIIDERASETPLTYPLVQFHLHKVWRKHRGGHLRITSLLERVESWLKTCFPMPVWSNRAQRTHRLLEKALELAQANGCSREDALALVDYVYGRPVGVPDLEVGG